MSQCALSISPSFSLLGLRLVGHLPRFSGPLLPHLFHNVIMSVQLLSVNKSHVIMSISITFVLYWSGFFFTFVWLLSGESGCLVSKTVKVSKGL